MGPLEVLRRGGTVDDLRFDSMYPSWAFDLSEMFWTPVAVAVRAAQALVQSPEQRVLDVGSGVGKFCLIGAAVSEGSFHGAEQRNDLVQLSRELAPAAWKPRLHFHCADALSLDWSGFDAIYLYNPFFELTAGPFCQIDDSQGYDKSKQKRCIEAVEEKLAEAAKGTRVATYFGFGGSLPSDYRKILYEEYERGPLEVWQRY